jgi:hypothetical protein
VEGAVGVEGDSVGVADVLLQADECTVSSEDLPAVVLAIHHVDEIVCGNQQCVRHVELAGVGAGPVGHRPEIETLWNEHRIAATEGEEVLAPGREAVDPVRPYPSATKMSPLGTSTAWVGILKGWPSGPLWPLAPSACKRRAKFLCSVSRLLERILTSLDQIDRWSITKETH